MASWVPVDENSDFSLRNLPYGIFSTSTLSKRIGVAIGAFVLDLKELAKDGVLSTLEFNQESLKSSTLNLFASLGPEIHQRVRQHLIELLKISTSLGILLRDDEERRSRVLLPLESIKMHLPMEIDDYTDFFVGYWHAKNCNDLFRPGLPPPPNFLSLPVAYHGRASSVSRLQTFENSDDKSWKVVISGSTIHRPRGQILLGDQPEFALSNMLDFEVEFAAFIAQGNQLGQSISVEEAESHIFGVVLMNDWSARDIQQWESIPLGPFNVDSTEYEAYQCNTRNVVFSFAQMIAHHTANGCPLRTGDLIATGTLTGPENTSYGCLLEATQAGKHSVKFQSRIGSSEIRRTFLEDGDEVEFRASANDETGLGKVGFGSCSGRIVASS